MWIIYEKKFFSDFIPSINRNKRDIMGEGMNRPEKCISVTNLQMEGKIIIEE